MRGEGTTTKQMLEAPHGAVFIWCNRHLDHPKFLARKHERTDLKIVSPEWLEGYQWVGLEFTGIVVDHATYLDYEMRLNLQKAKTRIRAPVNGDAAK